MFPLMALGAGLGQFAQDYRQQREANLRQAQAQLQLQMFQRQLQEQQREQQAATGLWSALAGGGLGGGQMQPVQGAPTLPQLAAPRTSAAEPSGDPVVRNPFSTEYDAPLPEAGAPQRGYRNAGGGMRAGGALTGDPLDLIAKYESGGRNIPQGIVPSGGGYNPSVGRVTGPSTAQGPWQITNTTWRSAAPKAGVDITAYPTAMSAPVEVQRQVAKALYDEQWFRPWAPYNANLRAAIGRGETAEPLQVAEAQSQQGIAQVGQTLDPVVMGRMSREALARRIDQVMPGADPLTKLMTLERGMKLLAPEERMQHQMEMMNQRNQFQEAMRDWQYQQQQLATEDRFKRQQETYEQKLRDAPGTIKETDEGDLVRIRPGSNEAEPITLPGGAKVSGKNKIGKPTLLEVTQEDGSVQRVQGQQRPDGQWVSADERRQPIDTSRGYTVIPGSAASSLGGSRDAAQRERQLIAGREVISDLQNVVQLPITTTRGIFGGRQQGPGLLDALRENLAETLTDEDAQMANSALAGLERELSIIVSPVYGGKWAAESFSALKLKEGQTNLVKLYNLARMRQTADNALEAMVTSPRIGREQKEYAKDMRRMLDEAVPWTPNDVVAFRSKSKEGQTFREFALKEGISGAEKGAGAAPGRMPLPDALKSYQDGEGFEKDGKIWVKQGNELIEVPGGVKTK